MKNDGSTRGTWTPPENEVPLPPPFPVRCETTGSVPSVAETHNAMADLWISFDLDHATFLMGMNSIANVIKEKEQNV